MNRTAAVARRTKETDITLELGLDGGPVDVKTGIGFLDHMLTALAVHGGWGLSLAVAGDTHVDAHHTVEDVGLCLGEALAQALGDYSGHARFGSCLMVMDDALAEVAVDAGRRPYLVFEADWPQPACGQLEMALLPEFWRAVCQKGGLTLHIVGRHARNSHHLAEAMFKGAGRALAQALAPRAGGAPSTKGGLL